MASPSPRPRRRSPLRQGRHLSINGKAAVIPPGIPLYRLGKGPGPVLRPEGGAFPALPPGEGTGQPRFPSRRSIKTASAKAGRPGPVPARGDGNAPGVPAGFSQGSRARFPGASPSGGCLRRFRRPPRRRLPCSGLPPAGGTFKRRPGACPLPRRAVSLLLLPEGRESAHLRASVFSGRKSRSHASVSSGQKSRPHAPAFSGRKFRLRAGNPLPRAHRRLPGAGFPGGAEGFFRGQNRFPGPRGPSQGPPGLCALFCGVSPGALRDRVPPRRPGARRTPPPPARKGLPLPSGIFLSGGFPVLRPPAAQQRPQRRPLPFQLPAQIVHVPHALQSAANRAASNSGFTVPGSVGRSSPDPPSRAKRQSSRSICRPVRSARASVSSP